ncbi:hypothetical protein Hanom_Chr10g00899941 [Helianthus anomalus]
MQSQEECSSWVWFFTWKCSRRMFFLGFGSSLESVQEQCPSWVWFFLGLTYCPNESFMGMQTCLVIKAACNTEDIRTDIREF